MGETVLDMLDCEPPSLPYRSLNCSVTAPRDKIQRDLDDENGHMSKEPSENQAARGFIPDPPGLCGVMRRDAPEFLPPLSVAGRDQAVAGAVLSPANAAGYPCWAIPVPLDRYQRQYVAAQSSLDFAAEAEALRAAAHSYEARAKQMREEVKRVKALAAGDDSPSVQNGNIGELKVMQASQEWAQAKELRAEALKLQVRASQIRAEAARQRSLSNSSEMGQQGYLSPSAYLAGYSFFPQLPIGQGAIPVAELSPEGLRALARNWEATASQIRASLAWYSPEELHALARNCEATTSQVRASLPCQGDSDEAALLHRVLEALGVESQSSEAAEAIPKADFTRILQNYRRPRQRSGDGQCHEAAADLVASQAAESTELAATLINGDSREEFPQMTTAGDQCQALQNDDQCQALQNDNVQIASTPSGFVTWADKVRTAQEKEDRNSALAAAARTRLGAPRSNTLGKENEQPVVAKGSREDLKNLHRQGKPVECPLPPVVEESAQRWTSMDQEAIELQGIENPNRHGSKSARNKSKTFSEGVKAANAEVQADRAHCESAGKSSSNPKAHEATVHAKRQAVSKSKDSDLLYESRKADITATSSIGHKALCIQIKTSPAEETVDV